MDWIVLVLLTLLGYSAGVTLGSRDRVAFPRLLDLGWITALWIAALLSRSYLGAYLGKWPTIGAWLVVSGLLAFVWTHICRCQPLSAKQSSPVAERNVPKRLWVGWKRLARQMGNFQGRVLLAMFYFTVITPFGVLVRLFGDPLRLRRQVQTSSWPSWPATDSDLESARNQF